MMADLPHTLYKKKSDKPRQNDVDEALRLTIEAAERKRKKREEQEKKEKEMTIEELFNEKEKDKKE